LFDLEPTECFLCHLFGWRENRELETLLKRLAPLRVDKENAAVFYFSPGKFTELYTKVKEQTRNLNNLRDFESGIKSDYDFDRWMFCSFAENQM